VLVGHEKFFPEKGKESRMVDSRCYFQRGGRIKKCSEAGSQEEKGRSVGGKQLNEIGKKTAEVNRRKVKRLSRGGMKQS